MDPFDSALEQAAAVRRRDVSALELVNLYLDRIERHNSKLNAFWVLSGELARDQAEEAGAGPLGGACATVKDVVPMAGYPLTMGARAFERRVGTVDHFVGGKMKEAGCPILGRAAPPGPSPRAPTWRPQAAGPPGSGWACSWRPPAESIPRSPTWCAEPATLSRHAAATWSCADRTPARSRRRC